MTGRTEKAASGKAIEDLFTRQQLDMLHANYKIMQADKTCADTLCPAAYMIAAQTGRSLLLAGMDPENPLVGYGLVQDWQGIRMDTVDLGKIMDQDRRKGGGLVNWIGYQTEYPLSIFHELAVNEGDLCGLTSEWDVLFEEAYQRLYRKKPERLNR